MNESESNQIRILIKDGFKSVRKKPVNFRESDDYIFSHEMVKNFEAVTLHKVKPAFVVLDTIYTLSPSLNFFVKHTHVNNPSIKSIIKRLFKSLFSKGSVIDKAVWITDDWSNAYFHWFGDALPRLLAAEEALVGHVVILHESYKSNRFIEDSLKLLNHKVIYYSYKLKVNELILPSHIAPSGNYNKDIMNFLRNRLRQVNFEQLNRKIYVSREKALKRKILNEDKVIEMMKRYEYEIHYFEDYSLAQQIELMSQAKFLVGLHGAGLTNMLFMLEGGKILELRNDMDAQNNCYFSLASELGLDYYYLLNQGNSKETHDVNLEINLVELENVLQMMQR